MSNAHDPVLVPANHLAQEGPWWVATGEDPFFFLEFGSRRRPSGWVKVHLEVEVESGTLAPVLYLDAGAGFSAELTRSIPAQQSPQDWALVRFPSNVRAIRFDPMSCTGRFRIKAFSIQSVSLAAVVAQRAAPLVRNIKTNPRLLGPYARKALDIGRRQGIRSALRHALRDRNNLNSQASYAEWIERYDVLTTADIESIKAQIKSFGNHPVFSVLVPLYNTPEALLKRCIESVREQLYPFWELCLADDASPQPHVQAICEEYARLDKRIRYVRREANGHIAAATNSALALATGDFAALLDHDDELAQHALYMVAHELNAQPELDMLFTDEDKIDEKGKRFEPWFKSDWNPELMLSQNAVVHLAVYRMSILRDMGGFRSAFDGSQDYDVTLRFSERTSPERIRHIPFILYHWRAIAGSVALGETEKLYPYEAARRAIQEHLDRTARGHAKAQSQDHLGYYRVKWPVPQPAPKVSIIIPTKDKINLLRVAVESILSKTLYPSFEIVVVNNRSEAPESLTYFSLINRHPSVRVIDYDEPYSFAALNNWAAGQTDGALLAFVNNDIEVISPDWLDEMVGHAVRPDVGSVGAKLLYPNNTIQHAGVVVGIGGLAGHPHAGQPQHTLGYFGRAACTQEYSAVTAACMVTRREIFEEMGGFDEVHFGIAFNDVDLGLRLHRAGYKNIWSAHALLYHHESASLGQPTKDNRRKQFMEECANFKRLWGQAIDRDPYYNPNLTTTGGDFQPHSWPRITKPWLRAPNVH